MASLSKTKKHLGFSALRMAVTSHFQSINDNRQLNKCDYSQHDALMSAFACMYFQDPALAQFQLRMEEVEHKNNLRTIFGVEHIPKSSQLRDIIDTIPSEELAPVFKDLFERLRRHKHLEDYAVFPNTLQIGRAHV